MLDTIALFDNLQFEKISSFISENLEFYVYSLNLFITSKKNNITVKNFLSRLESNLNVIENLQEGDAVGNLNILFQNFRKMITICIF